MQGFSFKQPWAWAIFHLGKDIENRNWKTNFRGEFLIHASKTLDTHGYTWITKNYLQAILDANSLKMDLGGFVGIGEIIDCVQKYDSPWFFGPWGYVLKNVRPIPYIPYKGKLGFFDVDGWVLEKLNI